MPFRNLELLNFKNKKLEQKLEAAGVSVTKRLQVGATIGCHIGPGAYGLIFVTK